MTVTAQDQDFETTFDVTAAPDKVFEALTTTSGVSGWWGPATGSATSGGELDLTFGEHLVRFHVAQAEKPTRVSWDTISCDVVPDWLGTTITFELAPTDSGGTSVHFRHIGLVPELPCYDQCSVDWTRYLHSSLVSYLETGTGQPVGS